MRAKSLRTVFVPACVLASLLGAQGCGGGSAGAGTQPTTQPIAPGVSVARTLQFNGSTYPYYLYVPRSHAGTNPMPSMLLLHGAGGNGGDFIKTWEPQAEKSGIALIAPTVPGDAAYEKIAPQLFVTLMGAAAKEIAIDPKRRYVFGYSNGGYATYDAAMYDSQFFAGVGVFAGIITPDYYYVVGQARRKTPIAIYIGDHDRFFTLMQARRTRDLLLSNGFPIHYVEYPNQNHNYPAIADTVNADAWSYLSAYSLP